MRALVSAMLAVALVGGCRGGEGTDRLVTTSAPSDLEALPDGGLLVAERTTGRVVHVDADGETSVLARVDVVASPGQRGLLGVVTIDGVTYASWTRAEDGRLVVGRVAPGATALVWIGPPSADLANGGRLASASDGALVVGIGDLTEPERIDDAATPNGKLLRLDPEGRPTQRPEVVSTGWHNPFAFTILDGDVIWVADNAPGSAKERLARGDTREPSAVIELDGTAAPAGILAEGDVLLVCGYVSGELRRYRPPSAEHEVISDECRYDVVRLANGRLAMADDDGVVTIGSP